MSRILRTLVFVFIGFSLSFFFLHLSALADPGRSGETPANPQQSRENTPAPKASPRPSVAEAGRAASSGVVDPSAKPPVPVLFVGARANGEGIYIPNARKVTQTERGAPQTTPAPSGRCEVSPAPRPTQQEEETPANKYVCATCGLKVQNIFPSPKELRDALVHIDNVLIDQDDLCGTYEHSFSMIRERNQDDSLLHGRITLSPLRSARMAHARRMSASVSRVTLIPSERTETHLVLSPSSRLELRDVNRNMKVSDVMFRDEVGGTTPLTQALRAATNLDYANYRATPTGVIAVRAGSRMKFVQFRFDDSGNVRFSLALDSQHLLYRDMNETSRHQSRTGLSFAVNNVFRVSGGMVSSGIFDLNARDKTHGFYASTEIGGVEVEFLQANHTQQVSFSIDPAKLIAAAREFVASRP